MFNFLLKNTIERIPMKIINRFGKSSARTKNVIKNIGLSLLMKGSNILCSLLVIPLTIDYINPERYGIWLTISSVIGWIVFFDLGLGNGFRNSFVKARACENYKLCKEYVSTTYITIGIIVITVWGIAFLLNTIINWASFLNVDVSYNQELKHIFTIVSLFTCLSMVVNLFSTLLTADLRPGISALIAGIGQWCVLISIIILKCTTQGSLINLAFIFAGIPCVTMLVASVLMFRFSRYKIYRPAIKYFRYDLLKDIMDLGMQFFIIYLCLIVIFQIVNLVISREIGPLGVTQYTIANKYFSVVYMVISIIMVPIWSAVTDAYEKKDFTWLHNLEKKLDRLVILSVLALAILLVLSPWIYKIWIRDNVSISFSLSAVMALSFFAQIISAVNMNQINGFGKLRLQTIVYVLFAIIAWPLFTYSARYFGLVGIVLIPAFVWLTQGIIAKIQINKILNGKATGIWAK